MQSWQEAPELNRKPRSIVMKLHPGVYHHFLATKIEKYTHVGQSVIPVILAYVVLIWILGLTEFRPGNLGGGGDVPRKIRPCLSLYV